MVEPQKLREKKMKKRNVLTGKSRSLANPVDPLLKCSWCELALCGGWNKIHNIVVTLLASINTVGAQVSSAT